MKEELPTPISEFRELNVNDMIKGIGRKATDEELSNYLSKNKGGEPTDIDEAFLKYETPANG